MSSRAPSSARYWKEAAVFGARSSKVIVKSPQLVTSSTPVAVGAFAVGASRSSFLGAGASTSGQPSAVAEVVVVSSSPQAAATHQEAGTRVMLSIVTGLLGGPSPCPSASIASTVSIPEVTVPAIE